MRLPPTIGDAPLPPPGESPPEDSEPHEPSEMLEAEEGPDELDLLFEELNREDPEAPVEEIDSLVPEISKMKVEPAEVSAGGEPGNSFKSESNQMVQARGRSTSKEVQPRGSSSSETLA